MDECSSEAELDDELVELIDTDDNGRIFVRFKSIAATPFSLLLLFLAGAVDLLVVLFASFDGTVNLSTTISFSVSFSATVESPAEFRSANCFIFCSMT